LNAENLVEVVHGRRFFVRGMCFSKDLSSYDMQSHAELAIEDHQSLIELFKQGNDIKAVKVISEHVKLFQRRVNHFMLPSLDIMDKVTPLSGTGVRDSETENFS